VYDDIVNETGQMRQPP